jgi:hypothetical protein
MAFVRPIYDSLRHKPSCLLDLSLRNARHGNVFVLMLLNTYASATIVFGMSLTRTKQMRGVVRGL